MRIVLLGAPGSGKRTQTKLIVEKYGIPAICTGELLKDAVKKGAELGRLVKAAMDAGRSVTEEVVLELIHQRLLQSDAQKGFVLDGFPRNILQAITLDELLIEIGQPLELAMLIEIETDALMERLEGRRTCKSCGAKYNIYINPTAVEGVCDLCGGHLRHRADDNEETISSRLHIYDHLVSPLIKHYSKQQKLKRVDGFGEIEAVFSRICQSVDIHEPPAPSVGAQPVIVSMKATDLQLVPEENPLKQLIPTGLEPAEKIQGKQKAAPGVKSTAKKPAVKKKRVKPKKSASKKEAKTEGKLVRVKKTQVKKASGSKKPQTRKKTAQKKKVATVKKAAAKKKAVSKTLVTSKKRSMAKKSAKPIKKTAPKEPATQKKKVGKKAAALKKRPTAKKKIVKKKAPVKKTSVTKKK